MFPWGIELLRGIQRYFRLLGLLIKVAAMRQMAYRPHFYMMILGKVIRIGLLFLFFQAVFLKVDRIGEWTYDQVLLLFATFHVVDYVMSVLFHRTLAYKLPMKIHSGDLDMEMVLPVRLLFLVSFEEVDMIDFYSFLPSLGFLGYVFYRLDFAFSWMQLLGYCLLVMNAVAFLFAVVLMISTVSFWTTHASGLARMFDNLFKVGRYPIDIFHGFLKIVFLYILPLVLIAQVPSRVLLEGLAPGVVLVSLCATAVFLGVALWFWRVGLRNYLSASS